MYNIDEYKKLIRGRMSDYRYYHSLCVAESAKKLALRYGADVNKAEVAGILHDVTKETPLDEQLEIIKKAGMTITDFEKSQPKFYHQISGCAFVKSVIGIDDKEITDAIGCHTTGRKDMTLMDEIVYLADFISADRDYKDVDIMRSETEKGREYGLLYSTVFTIEVNINKGNLLHPNAVDTYNYIISKYFTNNGNDERK